MPSSSESLTSDSSMISSRQVKQANGKRSIGTAHTSPTDVFGSRAGPPHSLCTSVSIGVRSFRQAGADAAVPYGQGCLVDDRQRPTGVRPETTDRDGEDPPRTLGCLPGESPYLQ